MIKTQRSFGIHLLLLGIIAGGLVLASMAPQVVNGAGGWTVGWGGQGTTVFSSGNTNSFDKNAPPSGNTTFGTSNYFLESIGGTASYKNGNGTYNTVTISPTWSSGGSSCSGGSLVSSCGSSDSTPSCPAGTQYNNAGYCEPVTCTTTGSGKGAQTTCVPTGPVTPSCPTGQTRSGSSCVPTQVCTTSGSGKGASTSCVPNPILAQTASCSLDGVTVPHNQSRVFFSQPQVPYGQSCASVATARMCNNGTLSGSSAYNRANCSVGDAPTLGTITINATPQIIRYDGSSRIAWDGGNAEACAVTGTNFSANGVKSSKVATDIREETVYTLTCVLGPYQKSVSTTVRIVPVWQEI